MWFSIVMVYPRDLKSQKPMVSWEQMMISGYFYGGLLGLKKCVFFGGRLEFRWNLSGISMGFQRTHWMGIDRWTVSCWDFNRFHCGNRQKWCVSSTKVVIYSGILGSFDGNIINHGSKDWFIPNEEPGWSSFRVWIFPNSGISALRSLVWQKYPSEYLY
jgi:hypothetical protein